LCASSPANSNAGDPLPGTAFAGWVRRQDVTGLWGWEAPGLPEWQRWWARFRFNDLPEVPEGFRFGAIEDTAAQEPRCRNETEKAAPEHLGGKRRTQRLLEGFSGT